MRNALGSRDLISGINDRLRAAGVVVAGWVGQSLGHEQPSGTYRCAYHVPALLYVLVLQQLRMMLPHHGKLVSGLMLVPSNVHNAGNSSGAFRVPLAPFQKYRKSTNDATSGLGETAMDFTLQVG